MAFGLCMRVLIILDPQSQYRRCTSHVDSDLHHLITIQAVYKAIKSGCRLLDGAADYGNEVEAGEGVHRAIKDGLVKREDLCMHATYSYIFCKLTCYSHHL